MGMAGKNIIKNKKEGAKEMQKTESFWWTKGMDSLPFFVNAEHGQRYGQILH